MRFSLFTILSFATLAANAVVLPSSSSDLQPRAPSAVVGFNELVVRGDCPSGGCSGGCTGSCPSSPEGSTSVNLNLTAFTDIELNYLANCVQAFIDIGANIEQSVKATILTTAIHLTTYTSVQLDELEAAFVAFLKWKASGAVLADLDIKVKTCLESALIVDLTTYTEAHINALRVFIALVVKANVNLTVAAKQQLLTWCNGLIVYSVVTLKDIKVSVDAAIKVAVQAVIDASVAATLKVKTALKVYVKNLIIKANLLVKVQLTAILVLIDTWIAGTAVLGLTSDLAICTSIIASLKTCGYDAITALGLNLTILSKTKILL